VVHTSPHCIGDLLLNPTRSVLECASPLALFHRKPIAQQSSTAQFPAQRVEYCTQKPSACTHWGSPDLVDKGGGMREKEHKYGNE